MKGIKRIDKVPVDCDCHFIRYNTNGVCDSAVESELIVLLSNIEWWSLVFIHGFACIWFLKQASIQLWWLITIILKEMAQQQQDMQLIFNVYLTINLIHVCTFVYFVCRVNFWFRLLFCTTCSNFGGGELSWGIESDSGDSSHTSDVNVKLVDLSRMQEKMTTTRCSITIVSLFLCLRSLIDRMINILILNIENIHLKLPINC